MQPDQLTVPDLGLLPDFARCGACGKSWDTGDELLVVVDQCGEEVNLTEFVGQPLSRARSILLQHGEHGGVLYDLSPYVRHSNSVEDSEVDWTTVIRKGDTGLALVTSYSHPECREDLPQE